jgi:thiol:disulfide interchange protein DsbC
MNTKSIFTGLATLLLSAVVWATPASDLLEKLKKTYPNIAFTAVNETPAEGIFEAVFGNDVLYVEPTGVYFFPTMVNMITKQNFGNERRDELNKVNFSDLPVKDAIKTVIGNGKNKIAIFADANCGYCKKLEEELSLLKDVTVYTYALGILGPDSVAKANAVNCSTGDKSALWHAIVVDGAKPVLKDCANGNTDRNLALFKKLGFQGTPAIVFQNGYTSKGYADTKTLTELMKKK